MQFGAAEPLTWARSLRADGAPPRWPVPGSPLLCPHDSPQPSPCASSPRSDGPGRDAHARV